MTERTREARNTRLELDQVHVFDLVAWEKGLWDETGALLHRSGSTLVKAPELRVVLEVLAQGEELQEHQAPGPITVQVLAGEVRFRVGEEIYPLSKGALLALPSIQRHAVEAVRDSVLLLTLAIPPKPSKATISHPVSEPETIEASLPEGATAVKWQDPLDRLTVAEIMNPNVVSVSPETPLREIAQQLAVLSISAVPVVNADGQVLGMVSQTDLIDAERRRVKLPPTIIFGVATLLEEAVRELYDEGATLTAEELMTSPVFTLETDAPARIVAAEMVERKINHVPVTREGKLVGIVARADLLQALQRHWRAGS